jgi:hypothetical protein
VVLANWRRMPFAWVRLAFWGCLLGWNIYESVIIYSEQQRSISFMSHIGGAVCGVCLAPATFEDRPRWKPWYVADLLGIPYPTGHVHRACVTNRFFACNRSRLTHIRVWGGITLLAATWVNLLLVSLQCFLLIFITPLFSLQRWRTNETA